MGDECEHTVAHLAVRMNDTAHFFRRQVIDARGSAIVGCIVSHSASRIEHVKYDTISSTELHSTSDSEIAKVARLVRRRAALRDAEHREIAKRCEMDSSEVDVQCKIEDTVRTVILALYVSPTMQATNVSLLQLNKQNLSPGGSSHAIMVRVNYQLTAAY